MNSFYLKPLSLFDSIVSCVNYIVNVNSYFLFHCSNFVKKWRVDDFIKFWKSACHGVR